MQYVCGQMSRAAQKRNPGRGSQRLHRALGGTRILLAAAPTAPPCFCRWQRSSRPVLKKCLQNRKSSTRFGYWISWWARVDYASRASKKAPQGLFCPPDCTAGRCCSNPPLRVKLEITDKTKNQRIFYAGLFGGAKQPKSEPLPSGASLAAISSKVMVFVPSL